MHALYTIGYEGATLDDFWATLLASGIRNIIDVREVPLSRRQGFSKKALWSQAEARGVRYIHLPGLGDPKEGRDAAKAGKHALFLKIFSTHMTSAEAQSDLAEAINLSLEGPSCLLCYERDPKDCHRLIVAALMAEHENFKLNHLGVRAGLALKSLRAQGGYGSRELVFGGI
jgi:uncharacterized protein (DUF488 family)